MVTTAKSIKTFQNLNEIDFLSILEEPFWSNTETLEIRLHKIHVYPAKFSSLIAKKAFEYAEANNLQLKTVADIFCGCGTVAVEAKRKGLDFWGCDINPVAVLISEVKSRQYNVIIAEELLKKILRGFERNEIDCKYIDANKRIQYWFTDNQYIDLYRLKAAIIANTEDDEYRKLFLCVFSSILKGASKWLTKSIKPQIDPKKKTQDVVRLFKKHTFYVIKAIGESKFDNNAVITIEQNDILQVERRNYADIIVTSPPYVTSYEYADLHQLSTLWLDYTEDYRALRTDSIGSSFDIETKDMPDDLTPTAIKIIDYFNWSKAKTRSIARYYSDMQKFSNKSFEILKSQGMVVFVIGDTEIGGHHIENAKCLCECMINSGFVIAEINKRSVQNKLLPSYRDQFGRFSSDKTQRSIYSQEFIVIGRKE
ncbi:MAG: DNA adenine methylase [Erysipelotrichaceae bacterium]|nr:DNA adenine methylase [Erysipelotrichaceae bacterium]